ncbi:MAG: DUF4433 domain-containing protein [Alphaproteobacteria bacterium]|nr:DUF4433 domain-containing protein [Alphaproteobacteria bacterium]
MQTIIENRKISQLIHFTDIRNIPSIIENGLISRDELRRVAIPSYNYDQIRADGHTDGLSLSIQFPNYQMFYRYQMDNPEIDWAIIGIKPEILLTHDCSFYPLNAASSAMSCQQPENLKGADNLEAMFANSIQGRQRSNLSLSENYTTSPQAEVLVFGNINKEDILGIAVKNVGVKLKYGSLLTNIKVVTENGFFTPRADYSFWT